MDSQKLNQVLNKDVKDIARLLGREGKKQRKINPWLGGFVILVFFLGAFGGLYFQENLKSLYSGAKTYLGVPEIQPPKKPQPFRAEPEPKPYRPQTSQEQAVIEVVKKASPSVVSIIISKEVPVFSGELENPFKDFEQFFGNNPPFNFEIPQYKKEGTKKQKVGGGTGFIISRDGLVLTNKHVVLDEEAEYTVVTNDGARYQAQVLARDPFQDLAVLKVERNKKIGQQGQIFQEDFPVLKLGDSSTLEIGQTVVAIGNALGEFRNTVSVGVISGLGRTITASGGGIIETLEDVIQTDAAINRGNSGGPLLNLKGEVIGVNAAMAQAAQSIGFAIPVNKAKRDILQVKTLGKIVYPFLGVRYILISPEIQEEKDLSVDFGALVIKGDNPDEPGVIPDSAAARAGLKEGDIILKVDREKITLENSLAKIIQTHSPGDKILLQVLREGKTLQIPATLGEKTSQ